MGVVPRGASEFVKWLVPRHPGLAPLFEDHLRDFDGEILAHVFFTDVTLYAADLARAPSNREAADELKRLLTDLDAAIDLDADGDPYDDTADNAVWLSFVDAARGELGSESLRIAIRSFPHLAHALSQLERANYWGIRDVCFWTALAAGAVLVVGAFVALPSLLWEGAIALLLLSTLAVALTAFLHARRVGSSVGQSIGYVGRDVVR